MPNKYVCIHGHFYQPPRENAWLEVIEQQESARPFHDWNARVSFESYAPNAAARILDPEGWIIKISNNYNRLSFNFGPTLLSWMEQKEPEAYALLQKADQRSMERCGGHGNALSQVYSHLIMPLANARDKVTQVHWGVRDFEHRFGRYPEGMWLSETAVNTETLEVLAAHGIQYTILAPRQAKAFRAIGAEDWQETPGESIDSRRPYWYNLPSGRRIVLFFYHGAVAQEIAFGPLLDNGDRFSERLTGIFDNNDEPQLVHVATDGETYGHHHRFGEMALADCFSNLEANGVAVITNYAQYLELHPPQHEALIHENSSWSCFHGVGRWQDDCGCNTGANPGWNQRWRRPLRDTLNWLRDRLIPLYEQEGARLLRDPWAARNDYIDLILDRRNAAVRAFLDKHARRKLSEEEEVKTLRLLEMQRHALLMFTSCGWFFDEISRIETNQILQYALRAMEYAHQLTGLDLQEEFVRRLAAAPSNVLANGAVSYLQNVAPTEVNLEKVAMHFAVASLFEENPAGLDLFNYTSRVEFFEKIEAGTPRLAIGRLDIRSRLTHAEKTFGYAALYLGQHHIIGNISAAMNRSTFDEMHARTTKAFRAAQLGEVIGILQEYFGPEKFSIDSLFADEKIKIIRDITAHTLTTIDSNFRQVFNDNYQLITTLEEAGLPLPDAWRNIANYMLTTFLQEFFDNGNMPDPRALQRLAADLKRWQVKLSDEETLRHIIGRRVFHEMERIWHDKSSPMRMQWLAEVLDIVIEMGLRPRMWKSQNVFYLATKGFRKGQWEFLNEAWKAAFERLAGILKVRLRLLSARL